MRALIQRVREASVTIDGGTFSSIGKGMLLFLGVSQTDSGQDAGELARRCASLRLFEDEAGKMNKSVSEVRGSILVVSQFTLYADTSHGNRPGFTSAAPPEKAEELYEQFVSRLKMELGEQRIRTGKFRAMMDVALINDGPVTIMMESKNHEG